MFLLRSKNIVLNVLRNRPETSDFGRLSTISDHQVLRLLCWLDRSGLSLYLHDRIDNLNATSSVPTSLLSALEKRQTENRRIVNQVITHFRSLNSALSQAGVDYVFLKGLTLVPDFCSDPYLRHFSDIDVLIPANSMDDAIKAAQTCGFDCLGSVRQGEVQLSTPQRVRPSRFDPVFSLHEGQMLEFHSTLWDAEGTRMQIPPDFGGCRAKQTVMGITFPALDLAHRFLFQLLHAFRHILSGSIRLAWLYEISMFLASPRAPEFWTDCCELTEEGDRLRDACGLVLALTNAIFRGPIPEIFSERVIRPIPSALKVWAETVGPRWAMSEPETNKSPLLIYKHFTEHPNDWSHHLWHSLLPLNRIRHARAATQQMRNTTRDTSFVIWKERIRTRVACLSSYPIEYLRFSLALRRRNALTPGP